MIDKPKSYLAPFMLSVVLFVVPASLRAAEQTSEHCIAGLFSPDRVSDLHKAMSDIPEIHLVHVDYENALVTFRYDLKTLFPTASPKKPPTDAEIELRLSRALGDASNDTFALKPGSGIPRQKLTKVQIRIGILDCKGCRYGAYLAVMKEQGVVQATVIDKLITAWIDPARIDQATIEAALKKTAVEVLEKK